MKRLFLIALGILFFAVEASAYFTMTMTSTSEQISVGNSTVLNITLINSGNEPSFNTRLGILSKDFNSSELYIGTFKQNAPFHGQIPINIGGDITPGKYPIIVFLHYTDSNRYPSSMVFPANIQYKLDPITKVHGALSEINLTANKSKQLYLEIRNLDTMQHNVTVRLFLPDELNSDKWEKTVLIMPKDIVVTNFEISSLGALPDSRYTILATLEYEENNIHYSSIAQGYVIIVQREISGFKSQSNNLFVGLIVSFFVLITLFLYLKFRAKK